jgi:hypothetical protein
MLRADDFTIFHVPNVYQFWAPQIHGGLQPVHACNGTAFRVAVGITDPVYEDC